MASFILLPVAFAILTAAIWIATVPPARLLKFDRRGGYHAYCREMERSGDEQKALFAAGRIYKLFALLVAALGIAVLAGCGLEIFVVLGAH